MWHRTAGCVVLLTLSMLATPLAAEAQRKAMPVIGYLHFASPSYTPTPATFLQGLRDAGYVEGHNVAIEYRWAEGHYTGDDPFFVSQREHIVALAARHTVPAIYQFLEFPAVGGLISYGPSLTDENRRTAYYVARILQGAKPADLPVERAMKFELVINLKTAKALGLTTPPTLLMLADEVIRED